MTQYRVVTEMTVEADTPEEAAMKVFALHDTMTPEDYLVFERTPPGDHPRFKDVSLTPEDKDEARRAYAAGEYFPEVDISEVKL